MGVHSRSNSGGTSCSWFNMYMGLVTWTFQLQFNCPPLDVSAAPAVSLVFLLPLESELCGGLYIFEPTSFSCTSCQVILVNNQIAGEQIEKRKKRENDKRRDVSVGTKAGKRR